MHRFLASASIVAVATLSGTAAHAQTADFDVGGQPLVFAGSGIGSGNTPGSFRDYNNVITIGGTPINARITLIALNGATLQDFDSTSNPYANGAFFQPSLNINSIGGSAQFRVDFTANGQPITLRNFYVNTYDLDGAGASTNGRQFTDFSGFSSFTLSSTSDVVRQNLGGTTRFITTAGGNITAAPGTAEFNDIRARVFYTSASSVTFTVGDAGATGLAFFGLDFSLGFAFNNAAADTTAPTVSAGQALSYNENQSAGAAIGTVAATDNIGVVGFRFASNDLPTSADGFYSIDATGTVRLTAAGAAAGVANNDFEITPNSFNYGIEAVDAAGNWSAGQDVTFTVLDLDDTAPVVTAGQSFAYAENQAANALLGTVAASDAVGVTGFRFAATGNATSADGFYTIDAAGAIRLTTAGAAAGAPSNDFETTPNSFIYGIEARDVAGNWSPSVDVTLAVTDLADTAPVITGPSGGPGATTAAVSVNENQTAVATLTADKPVTWSIIGGTEQGLFTIDPATGVITFNAAPNFEAPGDADTNNTYLLTVQAADGGNIATQTITVTVLDLDDTAPVITGPSGGAGAPTSETSVDEGVATATILTADEAVSWAVAGGPDQARFAIDPTTGALTFRELPDFEEPNDADRDNVYRVVITATDANGSTSSQLVVVTVLDIGELRARLTAIEGRLRGDVRTYAARSLGDMLSFNEGLLIGGGSLQCDGLGMAKPVSGSINADQDQQNAELRFSRARDDCASRTRLIADGGVTLSRFDGDLTTRAFGSLRAERLVSDRLTLGLGVMGSHASERLPSFERSAISDYSLQLNGYARYTITPTLRAAAFAGWGKAFYDFALQEDGLSVQGAGQGTRLALGGVLTGDIELGSAMITLDAAVSHARENLGDFKLDAAFGRERENGIAFAMGSADTTRISVPATMRFDLSGSQSPGAGRTELRLSPGLLCEDFSIDRSALQCGYQMGATFEHWGSVRSHGYATVRYEDTGLVTRALASLGYSLRFGEENRFAISIEGNQSFAELEGAATGAFVKLLIVP